MNRLSAVPAGPTVSPQAIGASPKASAICTRAGSPSAGGSEVASSAQPDAASAAHATAAKASAATREGEGVRRRFIAVSITTADVRSSPVAAPSVG